MRWITLSTSLVLLAQCSAAPRSPLHIRGGVSFERNPNYIGGHRHDPSLGQSITLGDLENNNYQAPQNSNFWIETETYTDPQHGSGLSIQQAISDYIKKLHGISPTLSVTSLTCLAIYIAWQIPVCRQPLSRHFICSQANLWKRPHSLLLSAVSHASFTHILMNMVGFVSLGPPLRQVLQASNWPLWPLVVGAALSGSFAYLLQGSGGCMGLSGVTLGMLALQAKLLPERQLGMVLAIFPVRVKAKFALILLLVISTLGSFDRSSHVAHLAHLGGLMYGMAYYEAWMRRAQLRKWYRKLRP